MRTWASYKDEKVARIRPVDSHQIRDLLTLSDLYIETLAHYDDAVTKEVPMPSLI